MKKPILGIQRTLRRHPIPQTAAAESFPSKQRPALSLASNNVTIVQPPSAQSDVPSIRSTVSSKSFTLPDLAFRPRPRLPAPVVTLRPPDKPRPLT